MKAGLVERVAFLFHYHDENDEAEEQMDNSRTEDHTKLIRVSKCLYYLQKRELLDLEFYTFSTNGLKCSQS